MYVHNKTHLPTGGGQISEVSPARVWILPCPLLTVHDYIDLRFSPLATGDTAMKLVSAAPVPWPMSVTRSGSPPNAGRFSRSQWRPATRSMSPKLPWAELLAPVFRKPINQQMKFRFNWYVDISGKRIKYNTSLQYLDCFWVICCILFMRGTRKEIKSVKFISVVSKTIKVV